MRRRACGTHQQNHTAQRVASFFLALGNIGKRAPHPRIIGALRRQRAQNNPRTLHIALLTQTRRRSQQRTHGGSGERIALRIGHRTGGLQRTAPITRKP